MALTREQLDALQRLISERRQAMTAEIEEDVVRARDETYGAVAGEVADPGDAAAADVLSDLDHAEISRDLRVIRELEEAQARIADGTYGICAACGDGISFARLQAYPAATRCYDCQRVHEKTHAQAGGATL